MLKIAGILILCLSVFGAGLLQDTLQRERICLLNKMERLIEFMHSRIRYAHCDIFTLFSVAAQESEFRKLTFLKPLSELKYTWTTSAIFKNIPSNFPNKELVNSFFTELGQTDICGQLEHCEIYKNLFAEKRKFYSQEYAQKGKVYLGLSSFLAAGLAIVLI